MNEQDNGGAIRLIIDDLADDLRQVRRTAAIGLTLAVLITMEGGAFALGDWNKEYERPVAWVVFLLGIPLCQQMRSLGRGQSAALLHWVAKLLALGILVAALSHYVWARWFGGHWQALSSDEVLTAAIAYTMAAGVAGWIWSSCSKAKQLQAFTGDGLLPQPLNLLDLRPKVPAAHSRGWILPPLRRWPGALAWALMALLLGSIATTLALLLALISNAMSYVMVAPQLLHLIGRRVTRPLFEAAARAAYKSRRYRSVDAGALLAADSRPPILVLRSFADDERQMLTSDDVHWIGKSGKTFEEILTARLQSFGPVIAIGRPGELIPSAGAAREYVGDADWRGRVHELIRAAAAIVVIAGKTNNLMWELQTIEGAGATAKTLIVVPADSKAEAADRLVTLLRSLDGTRLGQAIAAHMHSDAAVAMVGRVPLVELASARRSPRDFQAAIDLAMLSLRNARMSPG
jgi:hypothetical protein